MSHWTSDNFVRPTAFTIFITSAFENRSDFVNEQGIGSDTQGEPSFEGNERVSTGENDVRCAQNSYIQMSDEIIR